MESKTVSSIYTMLIADDHPLISNSLSHMIKRLYPDFEVLTANTAIKTLEIVKRQTVDFLLLDVMLDDGISLGNIDKIKKIRPEMKILVISQYPTENFGQKAIKLGADGYVEKTALISDIVKAINTVLEDELYIKQDILNSLVFNGKNNRATANPFDLLSKKEMEVAIALMQAKSRNDIAKELQIRGNTVSMHKAKIFEKLKISSILALKDLANSNNII